MTAPLLQISDLAVEYGGGSRALDGVSLTVEAGEIVAILGPNGAGKTTALRAISGLLGFHAGRIAAGSVRLNGAAVDTLDAASRVRLGVAQVMEARRIFGDMTVQDNLVAGAYTRDRHERLHVLEQVLGHFPILRERLRATAGYLSGGEQQMLAIGRALMARPRLLLLDEPSLGIAPKVVTQISDIVRRIHEQGVSVLLVEQNASVALELADRALILETGRIAMQGSAAALRADPRVRDIYLGLVGTQGAQRRSFRREAGEMEASR